MCGPSAPSRIAHTAQVPRIRHGEPVSREGDPGEAWYELVQGAVQDAEPEGRVRDRHGEFMVVPRRERDSRWFAPNRVPHVARMLRVGRRVILGFVTLAFAAAPEGLRPVVAPPDVQARYQQWVASTGAAPATLACEPIWSGAAELCLRVYDGTLRRWVTQADLVAWGTSFAEARAALSARVTVHLSRISEQPIVDMEARWWSLADGDGWAAAAVLAPDAVGARVGLPFRVAMPSESLMMAWKVSGEDVDHVMAVAVREVFDAQAAGVSASVHTWDGTRWQSWGRADPPSGL